MFDEIKSMQPMPSPVQGAKPREFRETQKLLTYRFLLTGPPGTIGRKWIPANGDSTTIAGKDSLANRPFGSPHVTIGPDPDGQPPNK